MNNNNILRFLCNFQRLFFTNPIIQSLCRRNKKKCFKLCQQTQWTWNSVYKWETNIESVKVLETNWTLSIKTSYWYLSNDTRDSFQSYIILKERNIWKLVLSQFSIDPFLIPVIFFIWVEEWYFLVLYKWTPFYMLNFDTVLRSAPTEYCKSLTISKRAYGWFHNWNVDVFLIWLS